MVYSLPFHLAVGGSQSYNVCVAILNLDIGGDERLHQGLMGHVGLHERRGVCTQ